MTLSLKQSEEIQLTLLGTHDDEIQELNHFVIVLSEECAEDHCELEEH